MPTYFVVKNYSLRSMQHCSSKCTHTFQKQYATSNKISGALHFFNVQKYGYATVRQNIIRPNMTL